MVDHLARDGSLERFTPGLLTQIKPGLLIAALACFVAGGLIYIFRERLAERTDRLLQASPRRALSRDANELAASCEAS